MTYFSILVVEQVLYLHELIISKAGGKQGIRDFAIFHSGLERCKVTFGGVDLYPGVLEKAAALWHSLTMNHPFLDGNKRTAYQVVKRFLYINGYLIVATDQEVIDFCISIDNDGLKLSEIVVWLEGHTSLRK